MVVPAAIEARLAGARLSAHLATTVDDRPHVAPVWYRYEDGVVSLVTGGRKLQNLRRNPRVALSIERADEERVHWTVTLLGTATVVEDPAVVEPEQRRLLEKYDDDGDYESQTLVRVAVGSATMQVY